MPRSTATKTTVKDVQLTREGTQIILPEKMSLREAQLWLARKEQEEETPKSVRIELEGFPLDGMVSMMRAIAEIYGWSGTRPTPGFWGPEPPQMIAVPISTTEFFEVPWGRITIPGIDGYISPWLDAGPPPRYVITGEVKGKDVEKVERIAHRTRELMRSASIYKGKAVRVNFAWQRNGEEFNPISHAPKFLDFGGIDESELIFAREVEDALRIGLFAPIERSEALRMFDVPLKRGVLLEGPYGTGKTFTAYVTAMKATRAGWTYIYLNDVQDLALGVKFAAQYAPAVVFAEDIDRVTQGRNSAMTEGIRNTLDGVDTKEHEIITVLTTNNVEDIDQSLLRPGRLDIVVSVKAPDAEAAERLIRLYGRGLVSPETELANAGRSLHGKIPAVIREVVERSKISTIDRLAGNGVELTPQSVAGKVTDDDLVAAANMMEMHQKLLEPKARDSRSPSEKVAEIIGDRIAEAQLSTAATYIRALAQADENGAAISEIIEKEAIRR